MNDWLNYKGSGSGRASLNTLAHDASIPNDKEAATKVMERFARTQDKNLSVLPSHHYDKINRDLDSLNSELNAVISAYKAEMAAVTQLTSAARNAKAKATIYTTRLRSAESKANAIYDAIPNANISDTQKTALTNKLINMINKYDSITSNTNTETSINWDTFESLINEINNNSKTNFRPRR